MQRPSKLSLALVLTLAAPTAALSFEKIDTRDQFLSAVSGKDLKILGITVSVSPAGKISGRAYGRNVSGDWNWKGGYFCRSLYWGDRDLGPNCQEVRIDGNKIRFTSDRGAGQYADLTIR